MLITNTHFKEKGLFFRFSINFMNDREDIYFHFNPRPREKSVISNSFLGSWGKEERKYVDKFPFLPLQYFDASFVCMEDKFTVRKT